MKESVLPAESDLSNKSTRLDPPHEILGAGSDSAGSDTSEKKWLGFAGRDPNLTTEQVDRQASELLTYVREQNREIDQRQAEINAKLAQLDNQIRNARLKKNVDNGADLLEPHDGSLDLEQDPGILQPRETSPEEEKQDTEIEPSELKTSLRDRITDLAYVQELDVQVNHFHSAHTAPVTYQEFEEVERLVAQFSDSATVAANRGQSDLKESDVGQSQEFTANNEFTEEQLTQADDASGEQKAKEQALPSSNGIDAFPQMLAQSHLHRMDEPTSMLGDVDALESERRLLADRKLELDRRNVVLNRMQEETQALHREALEMRLVTEQLWSQLSNTTPPDQLSELISKLRTQLDAHYAREQTALDARREEIVSVQKVIQEKQNGLREQANQLHGWFADRQEDIRVKASEIDAREMLLDQREHRMQDEFAKWQAQRKSYESKLKGLMTKLELNGLG